MKVSIKKSIRIVQHILFLRIGIFYLSKPILPEKDDSNFNIKYEY
jgi:hypothetical protein